MTVSTWPQAAVWCVAIISGACVIVSFLDLFRRHDGKDDAGDQI